MKTSEVVAAAIIDSNRILCVQRGESKLEYTSKKWEFPGGKVETGETHEAALKREIREELRLDIAVGEHLITVDHNYPDFRIIMHTFLCELASSTKEDLQLTEHLAFSWLKADTQDFLELDWAEADIPIVKKLSTLPV